MSLSNLLIISNKKKLVETNMAKIKSISLILLICNLLSSVFAKSIMKKGNVEIKSNERVNDVVVVDGIVNVDGVVSGVLYVVDSKIRLSKTSIVTGDITVNKGEINIESGAKLPKEILIIEGTLKIDSQKITTSQSQTVYNLNDETKIRIIKKKIPDNVLAFMKKYIVFDRVVPKDDKELNELFDLNFMDLGYDDSLQATPLKQIKIAGLPSIDLENLTPEISKERKFSGAYGNIILRVVKLPSEEAGMRLWKAIRGTIHENQINESCHVTFGDGAHWFFRYKNIYNIIWLNNNYLMHIELVHKKNDETQADTNYEEIRNKILKKINLILRN